MTEQTERAEVLSDAEREALAEVIYRELGDMVNRDYLIDAIVNELQGHGGILAAAEARGAKAVLGAVEAEFGNNLAWSRHSVLAAARAAARGAEGGA